MVEGRINDLPWRDQANVECGRQDRMPKPAFAFDNCVLKITKLVETPLQKLVQPSQRSSVRRWIIEGVEMPARLGKFAQYAVSGRVINCVMLRPVYPGQVFQKRLRNFLTVLFIKAPLSPGRLPPSIRMFNRRRWLL